MSRIGVLFMIVLRSLRQHALSSVITIMSAALASGLVMSVFTVADQSKAAFTGGDIGYDAVLGAKGSELQLVLNTVFHLETSPGNIPWSLYQAVKVDKRVRYAIPYALGDNLYGYRIVGTTDEIHTVFEYQSGQKYELAGGQWFAQDRMEAVFGSVVAEELGLRVGDTFQPYHGLQFAPGSAPHEEQYLITGVMRPTNTPADRAIWIPIEGIFRMGGHKLAGGTQEVTADMAETPDEWKEVSAVMLKFKSPAAGLFMKDEVRRGSVATLAWPIADVMAKFFAKMGWVTKVLTLIAYLVVVVAGFSLLASIYNTMNERRKEIAVLRALGAKRRTIFSVIVAEASTIALLGSLLGYVVYFAVLLVAASVIRAQTGVVLDVTAVHPALYLTPPAMVLVGALSGLLPAFKAYSTDVAGTLARV
ncbi:MAG: FtsX-like permease family protein [Planctomycetota bacterium]